jgi:excinuclease ABC subunit A
MVIARGNTQFSTSIAFARPGDVILHSRPLYGGTETLFAKTLASLSIGAVRFEGARYNAKTLEIKIRDKSIADVLAMTVDEAFGFFAEDPLRRSLGVLREVGLGYIRLGQSATELSGSEAQRVKLATELQRAQRGQTLYVLDEPTTGLHPSDVARLMKQLQSLVDAGNTVVVVEHDMTVAAASDWIIDIEPGAGDEGGRIVALGPPTSVAKELSSRTAKYLNAAF